MPYIHNEKDLLTGLYNHQTFLRVVNEKLAENNTVGILYIEFDDLARFNDTFGFDIDDKLLIALSSHITILLKDEILARVGTYRFAIAVLHADDTRLQLLAQEVIHLIKEPFCIDENMFYVTGTIGICLSSKNQTDTYALLKCAENTMMQLQKDGINLIGFYHEKKNPFLKQELQLMKDLPSAIDAGEFYFLYQPQYSNFEKSFTGAEILTRWRHHELGEISAEVFIPLAEKSGMITPLTTQILIEASKMFKKLEASGKSNFSLAVNISPHTLMEKHFLDTVSFVIQHYGLEGKNLTFEIMENTLPENMELFITLLHDIKKMGITIALDDYGTGHTSLKYLIDLPLDYIKIDRSFVSNVHQNKKKLLLLKTIIDMASILDLNVIAEGVEKEEEDKILKDLSAICTIQGYLYSKPIEAKALLEL